MSIWDDGYPLNLLWYSFHDVYKSDHYVVLFFFCFYVILFLKLYCHNFLNLFFNWRIICCTYKTYTELYINHISIKLKEKKKILLGAKYSIYVYTTFKSLLICWCILVLFLSAAMHSTITNVPFQVSDWYFKKFFWVYLGVELLGHTIILFIICLNLSLYLLFNIKCICRNISLETATIKKHKIIHFLH